MREVRPVSAQGFFEAAIPFCIARSMLTFLCTKGRIHFSIENEGSWTLELGNVKAPITRGLVGAPDLAVWYSERAFASFLDGSLDPRSAIRSGEFTASGDVHLLARLADILITPKATSQTTDPRTLN